MDFSDRVKKLEETLQKSKLTQRVAQALPPDLAQQFVSERSQKARQLMDRRRVSRERDQQSFMVPQLANKKGWDSYVSKAKPGGVFVVMDGNRFKRINDTFGHSKGDEAIRAMGQAVHSARQGLKGQHIVSHWGGDEFAAHFDNPEDANTFARNLRQHLENTQPLVGHAMHDRPGFFRGVAQKAGLAKPKIHQHNLSMAIGIGESFDQADAAQYKAKGARDMAGAAPGHDKTYIHSLHPAHQMAYAGLTAPVRKFDEDPFQQAIWEAQLEKSTPIHDSVEPIRVVYLKDDNGPVVSKGDIVQGWLEEPELDYTELRKDGQFLAEALVNKVWAADVGVAFKL